MVILYRKPAAAGERTRTPKDPSGPQWPQLTCPADLLLLPLAHLTKAHLCAFTASTECVPSDRGKRSGYYLKGIYFRKGRWGILGLLIKSGPWWCCWWRAGLFSVLINQQLCQRPVSCLLQTYLSLKMITIRKLVHQSPTSADICCSLVRRCLTVSAYMGRQANFQWNWKETHSQGHHACLHHVVSISAFAKKKKKKTHLGRQASFFLPRKFKNMFWPLPLMVDLVQLNNLHIIMRSKAERNWDWVHSLI